MGKEDRKIAKRLVGMGEERGYRRGLKKGLKKGLQKGIEHADEIARGLLVDWIRDVVDIRFKKDDRKVAEALAAVEHADALREVHRQAVTAKTLQSFKRYLGTLEAKAPEDPAST